MPEICALGFAIGPASGISLITTSSGWIGLFVGAGEGDFVGSLVSVGLGIDVVVLAAVGGRSIVSLGFDVC